MDLAINYSAYFVSLTYSFADRGGAILDKSFNAGVNAFHYWDGYPFSHVSSRVVVGTSICFLFHFGISFIEEFIATLFEKLNNKNLYE